MCKDVPYVYSWMGRLNTVKMPNSSQLIYRLNAIFIKTPKGGFWNATKMILPFIWKINRQDEPRTVWKQEIPGFRTYYKIQEEKVCPLVQEYGKRIDLDLERTPTMWKNSVQNMIFKTIYRSRNYVEHTRSGKQASTLDTKMFRSPPHAKYK